MPNTVNPVDHDFAEMPDLSGSTRDCPRLDEPLGIESALAVTLARRSRQTATHPYHFSRIRLSVESSLGTTRFRTMKIRGWRNARVHRLLLAVLVILPASLLAEPITLHQAVELALKHATGAGISAAEEQHASASYRELRNSYIPQL